MILLVALLMSLCGVLNGAAVQSTGMERIEKCDTRCSQGLQCKSKPHYLFPPPCRSSPEGLNSSSVFHNVSLSPVMRCEGRQKCSLHLRVSVALRLTESIHGLSVCTVTAGMMGGCRLLSFPRASRQRMVGQQVEVENDCFDISPGQDVQVTLKTVPSYCSVAWTSTYRAPECSNGDLRSHIPECITGRLWYDINPERKELAVSVSDMLEDKDYHLRLCHKDFICIGTGAKTLIKKEEPMKNATLRYSRPLPCLCIEGWSAMMDAPRVQVCPFKDRLEELWFGVTFDPMEETLSWEPACPVAAVIALCQKGEDGVCVDLPHASQTVGRGKITFAKVDPHPQLCMKFTAGSQSWTRCPFADGGFQAWEVGVTKREGHQEVVMLSRISSTFSVGVCVKSGGSVVCEPTDTHTVYVEKYKSVGLNLTRELCKPNSCLQVKRLDVEYAVTIIHCHQQCEVEDDARTSGPGIVTSRVEEASAADWEVTCVIVPAGACLSAVIIVALALHFMLTVYQRRKRKGLGGPCTSEKQTDPARVAVDCVVPALQTFPALHRQNSIPDPPQYGNYEKANLLSD
ncbi:interleukin-17 receptor E-like protein [Centroberyx gerrardi]